MSAILNHPDMLPQILPLDHGRLLQLLETSVSRLAYSIDVSSLCERGIPLPGCFLELPLKLLD
ncbi:hypothetical protein LC55x_2710 [Lysobacter capsici]|nr:hypothetical protein LC55x_2710 [Lysobacter capsici]